MRLVLDQHPGARRHARQPHPSAFGDFGHHLCLDASGHQTLKLEDPRLPMMMTAPLRSKKAGQELQSFVYVKPAVGEVLLWESWRRHEVPMNMAEEERISVSFNYEWA